MSNSKPEWLNQIRTILINNLSPFDVFVAKLGTPDFNATAKWEQLNDTTIEALISNFMDVWYEKTYEPSLTLIIKALEDMKRNDIVRTLRSDAQLNEQLSNENGCPCERLKPALLNTIRTILIDNLGQFEVFVGFLGTTTFNATTKWEQLKGKRNDARFFKFVDEWFQQTKEPSLKQIISALHEMHKHELIRTVKSDDRLKEQLEREGIIPEDHGDQLRLPTEATDGGCSSSQNS